MTGSFPLTIETPDSIAMQVLNVIFYGLPLEELQTFRERVNRVTVDDIERVARFYLKPDAVSVVLVGNASAFAASVARRRIRPVRDGSSSRTSICSRRTSRRRPGGTGGRGWFRLAVGRPSCRSALPPALRLASFQQPGRRRRRREGEGAARPGDCREGRPGHAAGHQEHQGGDGRDDDLACRPRGDASRPRRRPTCSIPIVCASKRRDRRGCRSRSTTASAAGSAILAACTTCPKRRLRDMASSLKRDTVAALLAAERGELRARLLPDVKDATARFVTRWNCRALRSNRSCCTSIPRTGLIAKQAYVVARARPAARSRSCSPTIGPSTASRSRLRRSARRRQAGRRAPAERASRSTPRSIPDCSHALTSLERAPPDFVRRAVRRSVRRRADARAARHRSGDRRHRTRRTAVRGRGRHAARRLSRPSP